jgi:hypothetical protein
MTSASTTMTLEFVLEKIIDGLGKTLKPTLSEI